MTDISQPDENYLQANRAEIEAKYGRWLGCIWADCHGLMLENIAERVFDCSDCGRRATTEYLKETGRIG